MSPHSSVYWKMGETELPHLEQPHHHARRWSPVSPALPSALGSGLCSSPSLEAGVQPWARPCLHYCCREPQAQVRCLHLTGEGTQPCSGVGSWLRCPDWVRGQELAVTLGRQGGSLPQYSASPLAFLEGPGHPPWMSEKQPCFRKPSRGLP